MPKDNEKILPEDLNSDHSLPGRFEEGNSQYFDIEPIKSKPKNKGILVIVIAFAIISSGFFSYYFLNQNEIDSRIIQNTLIVDPEKKLINQYNVGKYGSEHSHAAIVIFVNDKQLNFGTSQFQLSSKYVHFENHNPYLIHKHATGAPLEILFTSLGIRVTPSCIVLNYYESAEIESGEFCSDQPVLFYVNGIQYHSDLSQYVFDHNDRILISFGDTKSIADKLAYLESLKIFDVPQKTPKYSGDGITI